MLPVAALIVAFAGLFVAGVLSAGHLLNLPVLCGRGQGCLTVALHPSSKIYGIPVALFGVGAYLAIIFLLWQAAVVRWARIALVAVTGIGTVISGVLLIYSQTVIKATCPWCIASGIAMTLLFILSLFLFRQSQGWRSFSPVWLGSLMIITASAIGLQAGLMVRAANTPPIPAALLAGIPADELIDEAKSLGDRNAPITIIEFADLSCWACKMSHARLMQY